MKYIDTLLFLTIINSFSQGDTDECNNIQLLKIEERREKTAKEKKRNEKC